MKFIGLGILFKKHLIISDLHIGQEESLNKRGVMVPRLQFKKQKKMISELLSETKPEVVIINGDLKHEFSRINKQEDKDILELVKLIQKKSRLIIIEGNHDVFLKYMKDLKINNVDILDHYMIGDTYVYHGDTMPKDDDFKKAKKVIIGHDHPAITLREESKSETYKCFISAKYKSKEVFVTPSFHFLSEGSDVLHEKFLSPLLQDAKKVHIFIPEGLKVLDFGVFKTKIL